MYEPRDKSEPGERNIQFWGSERELSESLSRKVDRQPRRGTLLGVCFGNNSQLAVTSFLCVSNPFPHILSTFVSYLIVSLKHFAWPHGFIQREYWGGNDRPYVGLDRERGSSVVECRTRNQVSPVRILSLLQFRIFGRKRFERSNGLDQSTC